MSSDLIDIKKIDINNPAEVNGAVEFIIAYDLFVEAYLLYTKLREMESEKRESAQNNVMNKLKWVALPKLAEEEIIKMFAEKFTVIFEIADYDLWGKVKQKIIYDIWYGNRDSFKEKIKKALLKNEEKLTEKKIIINDKEYSPTVGNWLKDYNVALGFAPADAAKQSEYLTNSKNIKKLVSSIKYQVSSDKEQIRSGEDGGIDEKEKLKILFKFYERLKFSSLTAEGFEEGLYINEDGIEGVLDDGVFTEIDPREKERIAKYQKIIDEVTAGQMKRGGGGESGIKNYESGSMKQEGEGSSASEGMGKLRVDGAAKTPPQPSPQRGGSKLQSFSQSAGRVADSAKKAYVFSLSEQEVIKQNEDDIKRIARGNIILVGKELTRALEQKNRPRVIAALRLAVKNNLLIGWSYKHEKRETEHEKREDNKIVISFLKQVLQEKLGLSENEAAKIGAHLFNLFKKQGREIGYLAYYDEKEEKFRWME